MSEDFTINELLEYEFIIWEMQDCQIHADNNNGGWHKKSVLLSKGLLVCAAYTYFLKASVLHVLVSGKNTVPGKGSYFNRKQIETWPLVLTTNLFSISL